MSRRFRRSVAAALCLAVAAASMMGTVASAEEIAAPELENPLKAYDKNSYSLTLYQKMVSFFPTEKEEEEPQTPQEETPGMSDPGMMAPGVEEPSDAGAAEESPSGEAAEENEEDAVEQVVYPDEYAGAYIDDNDNLHIKLVGKKNAERYEALTNNDESVIIEEAATPLSKLHEIQDALDEVMEEFEISETRLQEDTNTVDVYVREDCNKKLIYNYLIKRFEISYIKSSLSFEISKGNNVLTSIEDTMINALPGAAVHGKSGVGTIGFNAFCRDTLHYGLVTNAHVVKKDEMARNALNININYPEKWRHDGDFDATFIPFPAMMYPSYKFKNDNRNEYNENFTGYLNNSELIIGLKVTKLGINTGETQGKILTIYQSTPSTDDCLIVSNRTNGGDSGGPVFHSFVGPLQPTQVRPIELVGITSAKLTNGTEHGVVKKIQPILDYFNLTLFAKYK